MKLSIQLRLLDYRFRILFVFLSYLVSNTLDRPLINGCTKSTYSTSLVSVRITFRLMRLCIQLNDGQYRLYAAVDPETNELLHTTLEPTTNKVIAHAFFAEFREKHDVSDVPRNLRFLECEQDVARLVNAVFLVDYAQHL